MKKFAVLKFKVLQFEVFFFIFRLVVLNKACIPNLGFLLGIEHTFPGGGRTGDEEQLIIGRLRIVLSQAS